LLIAFADRKTLARILLVLLVLAFMASFGLALFHMGVENKWWTYASDCAGGDMFKPGASAEDILAALKRAPVARCDEKVDFLFGMSMAFYNVLTSAFLAVIALYGLVKSSRR